MKLTDNRWLTGRGFGVHSPWAYDLIDNVINERHPYYAYEDLYPFWEKAPQYMPQYPQSRDELLFRLVNRFNPRFILEVGTGAGVSTGYLASVSKESRVITVDFPNPGEKRCVAISRKSRILSILQPMSWKRYRIFLTAATFRSSYT